MALSKIQIKSVEETLRMSLRNKFQNYKPEPAAMPFHTRLLGEDRLALYSFIHSLGTNFGSSIFEPVGIALAKKNFKLATAHEIAGEQMSTEAQMVIQKIIDGLTTAIISPDKTNEIEQIRKVCRKGAMVNVKPTRVDLFLERQDGAYFLFDIKTAKPNAGSFREFKRTLLEWIAVLLANKPEAVVNTFVAIPYNPYEPAPYNRWTMRGMLDIKNELMVGEEFWNFLGNGKVYQDLLDCFERVGVELKPEIDQYFQKYK